MEIIKPAEPKKIPFLLKHFLFSSFAKKTQKQMEKEFPEKKIGKLVSMSFILTHEGKYQTVKFEHYEGTEPMTEKEIKVFSRMTGIDMEKEIIKYKGVSKSVFIIIHVPTKTVYITYNYVDGTTNKISL